MRLAGDSAFAQDTTVRLALSGPAQAGVDYRVTDAEGSALADPWELVLGAGEDSVTARIQAIDDDVDEEVETVTVRAVRSGINAGSARTLTIADDDETGVVVSPAALTLAEGATGTYTVALASEPTASVTVTVSSDNEDVTAGGPLTFTASDWSTAQTVTVAAAQDANATDDTATLTNTAEGGGYDGESAGVTVTVTDDDTAPTAITLTASPGSVLESASGTTVTVTATLDGSVTLGAATEVTVSVGGGSATSGTDYAEVDSFTVTIPAERTSGTGTFNLTPTQDSIAEGDETIDVTGAATGFTVTKAEMTLTDDEAAPTAITLTVSPGSVGEDDGQTEVTVTATLDGSVTLGTATEVTVSVGGGTAPSGTDYAEVDAFTVTIPKETASGTGTFTLTPTNDSVVEGDETIDVTGAADGFTVTKAQVTLTDDDTTPTAITLTASPASVSESASETTVTVTATLDGSATLLTATEVTVSVGGGTAASGADYAEVSDFAVTIPAQSASGTGTFTLTPANDSLAEGDESIDVTGSAADFTVTKAQVTLTDDDTAPTAITLSVSPASVSESASGTTVTVTATLDGSATLLTATTVTVSVGGGSATSGTDYTAVSDFTVTIPKETASGTGTFTLTPTQDTIAEGDETIDVTGAADGFTVTKAEMTLTDDETAPGSITLTVSPTSVSEDDGATPVTVTATLGGSATLPDATEVTVSVGGGSATSGTDYTAVSNFTVTIPKESASGTGTFTLTPTNDSLAEGEETIDVTGTATGFTVTGAQVTLTDDAPPVEVGFARASYTVAEGGTVTVTVELSAVPEREVEVALTHTAQGDTTAADYSGVPTSVTFDSDETEQTFTFTAAADDVDDDGDSVLLGFGTPLPDGVSAGATATSTVSITDDDVPPVQVFFEPDAYTVAEDSAVTVTVRLDVAPERLVSVPITVANQGDTTAADYSLSATSVVFAGDETEQSFRFGADDDTVDDDGESVVLGFGELPARVSAPDTTARPATATVSITDDDTASASITLTTLPATVSESASGTTVTVTATLGGSVTLGSATQVTVSVGGGTATLGTDYAAVSNFTVTIPKETASGTGTFTLTPMQDSIAEGDETIDVTGSATDFTVTKAEVTLTDDETAPASITLTVSPTSVSEDDGATPVTVTATLGGSATLPDATEVTVSVGGGSATLGTDYTAVSDFTVTIPKESASGTGTFTLTPTNDSLAEGDETIDVTGMATDFTVTQAQVTLTDDVPPVEVSYSQASYTVAEGSSLTVTVELSAVPEREVEVALTHTAQGNTTAADYSGVPTSVTFASDETSKTFSFAAAPDEVDDDGDSVVLGFGSSLPASVTVGSPATATVNITDNDDPAVTVSFGASSYTVAEGSSLTVTVELSGAPEREVEVALTHTAQGNTTAADYSGVPTSVTFASDETSKTFTFTAAADDADDDGDSVVLGFETPLPDGVSAGATATSTVSITDDDVPSVQVSFGASSYTVAEGLSVTVTVELSAAPERSVSVPLTHAAQGDTTAADYSGVPTSVTFAADETEQTFTFTAAADDVDDDGDSVLLGFGTPLPDGVSAGATATSTVSITDDDVPSVQVSFGASSYTVAEGSSLTVTVELDIAPEREVEVALTHTAQGNTTAADYSGVPTSVTFASDETSKTFSFAAAPDEADDDGDSVLLGFGSSLPASVTAGSPATATVNITDNDDPAVTVSFGASSYTVAEGSSLTVTVELSGAPEREVEVALTHTAQGNTTAADYSGVPTSVTFASDETSKTFTFTAAADDADDDGDSVVLGFETPLPDGVSAGATATSTVSITDDDVPSVQVSFGASSYTVAEGLSVTVTVELSAAPERSVSVPLTHAAQGDTTAADYSGVPTSVTFAADETEQTFTFTAAADDVDDDGDSVLLGFGTPLPDGVSAGATATSTVSITDDDVPSVQVSFGASSYTVAEGSSLTVTVELDIAPEREVEVALTHTAQGDTTAADYSGVPTSVTFAADETSKTFSFAAAPDEVDDDGDSVVLGFGSSLPASVTAGSPATATVNITDNDDPAVTVSFGASSYTVAEGSSLTVTVELSGAPEREVEVALTHTAQGNTTAADYSGVPTSVTFASDETSKTFTFTAAADDADDDGDSVVLGFETPLPDGVSAGATATSTVSITDDDVPSVQVSFGASSYTVAEGLSVTVTVELSAAPERSVSVPLTHAAQGDTTAADYSGVPTSVTFAADETEQTFTFTAAADDVDDDGDSVLLGFGTPLPDGVSAGATATSTVSITDDDVPSVQVSFGASSYTVAEGSSLTVTVELDIAPEREVEVALTHTAQGDTTAADYSGVPTSVTFAADETSKTFSFAAAPDEVDDDGDSVVLGFGSSLPASVTAGSPATATVNITDNDDPAVTVSFGASSYTVAEGSSLTVTVELSGAPEREVEVALTHTAQGNTTAADYSGVPTSVTFASDETSKTFTFTAAADDADDDGDSVVLGFETPLPDGVSAGATATSTVSITDDDVPSVQVSFGASSYTVAEGLSVTVTVELSAAPERSVSVPLTHAAQGDTTAADYSGVPTSVTFAADETEQTFTFTAAADDVDDDGDSVLLGFGTPLPDGVSAGATATSTVSITDDDVPSVQVSFGASSYTVAEGSSLTVTVELDIAPEREVEVALTHTAQGDTTDADYSGVPTSVTFASDETSKTFSFAAAPDEVDDDGDSVVLGFGSSLPASVTAGSPATATVNITDNDDPAVTVSFGASSYTVAEGSSLTVTVELSGAPEREVEVALTHTAQGNTTAADYSGVPTSVTFASDETSKTFSFAAAPDEADDDGDSVLLGFGSSLPASVTAGSPATATVNITDNDDPAVTVSFGASSYTVAEGSSLTVTVELSGAPEREVEVALTHTAQGNTTAADYSGVPTSVTFASDETSKTFTFTAAADDADDDGDSVVLGFETPLPDGVSAGATATSTVSITDDDVPSVQVSFGASSYTVAEGLSVTVTVELSAAPERSVSVPLTHAAQGDTTAADYSGVPTLVVFAGDETEQSFRFGAANDTVDDDGESVVLGFGELPARVSAPDTTARPATATVSITDDDTASASITLTTLPVSVSESASETTVTVTATLGGSVTLSSATQVTVSVGGGTATLGTDYAAVSDFTVTIPKESASGTGTFTLTPTNDSLAEGNETIDVTGTADGFTVTKGEMTLTDDDTAQRTVSFDKQVFTVTEGAARQVLMQVDLSGPLDREVAIPLTTTHGSGVEANDYVLAAIGVEDYYAGNDTWTSLDGDLVFPPAETAKIVQVTAVDDSIVEDDEILELGFGTLPEGIFPGSIQVARVTITDNDGDDGDNDDGDNDNDNDDANRPPVFTPPVLFTVAENRTAVGTVAASDSDDADSITGYALAGGADRALFSIDSTTGALRFLAPPNHEEPADADANNACEVVVEATSGTGDRARTAQQSITVTVTDVDEQPERPAAPGVDPTAGSATSLDVSWIRPGRNGGPSIIGYELRYRRGGGGAWSDRPHAGTDTSTAIGGLETDTSYQVQVRALNGETPSEWSPIGTGRTAEPEPALIRNVAVVNGPGADGVWSTGERVEAEVRYSRPVAVEQPDCWTYDADGTCRPPGPFVALAFRTAGHPGYGYGVSHALATYEGGSRTRVLRFAYTVGAAEDGAGNVVVADDGLLLRGATIRTLEGGDGASRYTNTRVMQVTVEKPAGGAWTAGDRVRIKVRFAGPVPYSPPDEPVNLDEVVVDKTGGTPSIGVRLADALDRPRPLPRTAFYAGGSGTNTLVFEYEVAAGDGRVDVAEVVADSLARNGATIRNEAGYDAELEHLGSVWTTWHDVEIPRVKMSVRGGGREHEGGTLAFTVELEEASVVPLRAKYATADGTARAGRDYKAWSGAVYFEPDETRKTVRVPLLADTDQEDEETVRLRLVEAHASWPYDLVVDIVQDEAQGTILDGPGLGRVPRPTPAGPLTARFAQAPFEHDGASPFTVRIAFSEAVRIGNRMFRDHAIEVTEGRATKVRKVNARRDLWEVTVEPESFADVSVSLPPTGDCAAAGALCTDDGRALSKGIAALVRGPAALSVADARVREAPGASLAFAVTLDRPAPGTVTVDYATADGSATAGADYTARSGTLTFAPGETAKTVSVPVLDDAHDEGEETLTLALSNASGARIEDGAATGTIENSDPLPQAWLARFGRTVATQVADAIGERLTGGPGGSSQITIGGRRVELGHASHAAAHEGDRPGFVPERGGQAERDGSALEHDRPGFVPARGARAQRDAAAHEGREPQWAGAPPQAEDGWRWGVPVWDGASARARPQTAHEMLMRSSFLLALGGAADGDSSAGPRWTAWGRAAASRFDGDADGLSVHGEVTTVTLGADAAWARWLAGVAVAMSDGEGGFRDHPARTGHEDRGSGRLVSTLASVHPYVRLEVDERLLLWGILGAGAGEVTLEQDGTAASGRAWTTDTALQMVAAGARSVLVPAPETGGLELAARADVLMMRITSEAVSAGEAGNLAASEAGTSRLRLIVEGSRTFEVGDGGTLTPSLELGLRADGGDAETGMGVELGAGLAWADPATGLTVQAKARGLVAHEAEEAREWGVSGEVRLAPGASGRGLSLTLAPAWGAASSGTERLWGLRDVRGLAADDGVEPGGRVDAEVGYGLAAFGGRGLVTPYAGLALSDAGGRTYRTGARWTLVPHLAMSLEGTRRDPANDDAPEHGVQFRLTLRW